MRIFPKYSKRYKKELWAIDLTVGDKRFQLQNFFSEREAQEHCAQLIMDERAIRNGLSVPMPQVTLGEFKAKYEKDASEQAKRVFGWFYKMIDDEDFPVSGIKKKQVKDFHDMLVRRGLKNGSLKKYMSILKAALNLASSLFDELDAWRPPQAPKIPDGAARDFVFELPVFAKILAACLAPKQWQERHESVRNRQECYDLLRCMFLSGMREGEVLKLQQSQIDWNKRTAKVVSIKGQKGTIITRYVPLSPLMIEILKSRLCHAPYFFNLTTDGMYDAFRRIGAISGVPYGDNVEGGWVPYDTRHTSASVIENAGIPYSSVAELLGHKQAARVFGLPARRGQTADYLKASKSRLQEAIGALEDFLLSAMTYFHDQPDSANIFSHQPHQPHQPDSHRPDSAAVKLFHDFFTEGGVKKSEKALSGDAS